MSREIVYVGSNISSDKYLIGQRRSSLSRPEEKLLNDAVVRISLDLKMFNLSPDEADSRANNLVRYGGIPLNTLLTLKTTLLAAIMVMVRNNTTENLNNNLLGPVYVNGPIEINRDPVIFNQAFEEIYPVLDIKEKSFQVENSSKAKGKGKKVVKVTKTFSGLKNPLKTNKPFTVIQLSRDIRNPQGAWTPVPTNMIKEQRRADVLRYLMLYKQHIYVHR